MGAFRAWGQRLRAQSGGVLLAGVLLAAVASLLASRPARADDAVVGSGTPASCTDATFGTAFFTVQNSGGGTITFDCGSAAHTIVLSALRPVSAPTVLHGGDRITLSGNNATSLFQVFANASLRLERITLTRALGSGGAVENFGALVVVNATLSNNRATMSGGAIANMGTVSLLNATLRENSAAEFGGGLYVGAGSASVQFTTFADNRAGESDGKGGGGLALADGVTVTVAATEFTGNKTTATFAEGGAIHSRGSLSILITRFDENNSSRGGAIFVAGGATTLVASQFAANWAAYGGAVRQVGGSLLVEGSEFDGNGASATGVKIATGGGAFSFAGGTATLRAVTIADGWASYGGGFEVGPATVTLENSTISGNASVGSAAMDIAAGSVTLTHVTIANNRAPFFAGGIAYRGGTLTVRNTLLSGNINPNTGAATNCNKTIAATASLSSDFSCGFGSGNDGADLRLGPLLNNGGLTRTHRPLFGSAAFDTAAGAFCPATDQRAVNRPQGAACDVGAVEATTAEQKANVYLPFARR